MRVPGAKVALSTASCYPETCTTAFEMAADLGFDGVEVMVWTDPVSQDPDALRGLSERFGIPVLAIHAPCLLTQRVWSTDPWAKLQRARGSGEGRRAHRRGARPSAGSGTTPAASSRDWPGCRDETDVAFAVENMFPWRARSREVVAYLPLGPAGARRAHGHPGPVAHRCLRLRRGAGAGRAGDRLSHVHLADGSGSNKDEHLVPGRGNQPCAEVLERLARAGYDGSVVLEINTRRAVNRDEREADLAEGLAFARLNLAAASSAT